MVTFADLTRPCDACGKPIGAGFRYCKKCNIYFCFFCGLMLDSVSEDFPSKYLMCGGEFWFPE